MAKTCVETQTCERRDGGGCMDELHAVIRFKRDVAFPRFSMKCGERWGFVAFKKRADWLRLIKAGERFDFAGGQCLAEDVEVIYEGPPNTDFCIAAGYIKPNAIEDERVKTA